MPSAWQIREKCIFLKIQLSDHFTYKKLLQFTISSIVMMIVTSMYSVIDGLFVSNLVGDLAFSAVNIVMPVAMIIDAFGFMLGSGGSAIVARTLGEGKEDLANRYFSMIIACGVAVALVLTCGCLIFMEPLMRLAGASDKLLPDCVLYGRILIGGAAPFMLQTAFQTFLVVAEKPQMGLAVSIAAGITNILLDFVFIKLFGMGIAGAGLATVIGYLVGGVIPLCFFAFRKKGIRLVRPRFYGKVLLHACTNGSSEMMNNLAVSLASVLFNIQLMRLEGEAGVAAFGVMMYVDFIFLGIFFGFSMGSSPVVSYHYGAGNHAELKSLFRKSMVILSVFSLLMVCASQILCKPLSSIFVGYDKDLFDLTVHGFHIFALNYAFCGFNIYASAFFTALCNGKISAFLSFLRSLLLRGGMVLLLPLFFGLDGIWAAVAVAEGAAVLASAGFFIGNGKRYHYR